MFFIIYYLVKLIIAPQLFVPFMLYWRVDYFLFPAWFLWALFTGRLARRLPLTTIDMIMIAWASWVILSTAINPSSDASAGVYQRHLTWILLYLLVLSTLTSMHALKRAAFWLVAITTVVVIEGIQHKLSPDGLGWAGQELGWVVQEVIEAGGSGRTRWIGIFDGPGVFAVIYTLALPFILPYTARPHNLLVRLLALGLLCAFLVALYFTGSRGGMLATLGILGMYLLYRMKVSTIKLVYIGAISFAILAAAPEQMTSTRDSSNSAQHRVELWADGIEMAVDNPVFGVGRGRYHLHTRVRKLAHNSAIEIMGTNGFPGLFLWITLLYLSLKSLYVSLPHIEDERDKSFVVMLGISLSGYIISSMFVTLEYETLYFLIAMCAAVGRLAPRPATLTIRELLLIGAIMAAFFIVMKSFIMIYFG